MIRRISVVGAFVSERLSEGLELLPPPDQTDIELWLVALMAMVADIALTLYGLQLGLIERNPIALLGIRAYGYAFLAFLKTPALGIGLIGYVVLPKTYRQLNLIGLSLPWLGAVALNSWLIIMAQ